MKVEELDPETRKRLYKDVGIWENGHTLGVCQFMVNIILLMRWPQYFWVWHLVKAFIYLPLCFKRKCQSGYEWFMIEFCYANVYYTVILCSVALLRVYFGIETPLHALNFEGCRTLFAFSNGVLLLSVPMFGNKLVFHDIDNTIALYIHLSPALMTWSLRWGGGYGTSLIEKTWPTLFDICEDMMEDSFLKSVKQMFWSWDECHADPPELILYPALTWLLLWGLPYFLVRFCFFFKYIENNKKQTMYGEVLGGKSFQAKILEAVPEWAQPYAFMLQHLIWTNFACLLSVALWHSFVLHTLLLVLIGLLALHNGSTFLFRVVALKKVPELMRIRSESNYEVPEQQYEPAPLDDTVSANVS